MDFYLEFLWKISKKQKNALFQNILISDVRLWLNSTFDSTVEFLMTSTIDYKQYRLRSTFQIKKLYWIIELFFFYLLKLSLSKLQKLHLFSILWIACYNCCVKVWNKHQFFFFNWVFAKSTLGFFFKLDCRQS